MKKILCLLSLSFFPLTTFPITPLESAHLDAKIAIADEIFKLLQKRSLIDYQENQAQVKLQSATTLPPLKIGVAGLFIGSAVMTGVMATPGLAIRYLNPYITPKQYQPAINTVSSVIIGLPIGQSILAFTRLTRDYISDYFAHRKERQEIQDLQQEKSNIEAAIKDMTDKHPELSRNSKLTADEEKIYKEFITFFNTNQINKEQLSRLLPKYPGYSVPTLITIFKRKKIEIILSEVTAQRLVISKNPLGMLPKGFDLIADLGNYLTHAAQTVALENIKNLNEIIKLLVSIGSD